MSVDPNTKIVADNSADAQEEWAVVETPGPRGMKTCPQCQGWAIRPVPGLPRFPRLWKHQEKPQDTYLPCPLCQGLGVVPDLDEFAPTSAEAEQDWRRWRNDDLDSGPAARLATTASKEPCPPDTTPNSLCRARR